MPSVSHNVMPHVTGVDVGSWCVTPLEAELHERIAEADAKLDKDEWVSKIDIELLQCTLRKVVPFLSEDHLQKLTTTVHVGTVGAYREDVLTALRQTLRDAPHAYRGISSLILGAGYTLVAYRTPPEASEEEWREWMETL